MSVFAGRFGAAPGPRSRITGPGPVAAPRPIPDGAVPVVNVHWGYGFAEIPATWQNIGKFFQGAKNLDIVLVPGTQRRNGVGDISSRYMSMPNPNWQQQSIITTPGTQRSQGSPPVQGPGSYRVYRMRGAVLQAQMNQSGAQLAPYLQAMQQGGT
jgi:hypothetical protein